MDELQDAIQDAQYMGAMSTTRPRPTAAFKLPTEEELNTFIELKTREKPKWLSFVSILSQPLGFYLFKRFCIAHASTIAPIQIQFIEDVHLYRKSTLSGRKRCISSLITKYCTPTPVGRGHELPQVGTMHRLLKEIDEIDSEYIQLQALEPLLPIGVSQKIVEGIQQDDSMDVTLFDTMESLIMMDLREKWFESFKKSEEWKKWLRFRYLQSCKVTHADFSELRILGRGGFGLVTACTKRNTGTLYAMKKINKKMIQKKNAETLCITERNILSIVSSPFIVCLKYAFQHQDDLILILDIKMGGDLSYHLSKQRFTEDQVRLWCAQIVLALEHFHSNHIVYRDLKPENLLLDDVGNCSISDLGLAVQYTRTLSGRCGTRGYWAPEMLVRDKDGNRLPYDYTIDWWGFGCVVYELLYGKCPFRTTKAKQLHPDRQQAYDIATLEMEIDYDAKYFSPEAKELIQGLLDRNPKTRLGSKGAEQVKNMAFFESINWLDVEMMKPTSTFRPGKVINAASQATIGLFDLDETKGMRLTPEDDELYDGWDFVSASAFQEEIVKFMEWELTQGPIPIEKDSGNCCCTVL